MRGNGSTRGFALSAKDVSGAAVCLFVILSLATVLFPGSAMQLWRGYATVATPHSIPLSLLRSRLSAQHLDPLMADTAQVSFTDFSGSETVALSRLPDHLDSLDPRYDPYLRELPSYFRAGTWNLCYVHAGWPFIVSLVRTAIALHGLEWRSGDYSLLRAGFCLLAQILIVFLILLRYRNESREYSLTVLIGSLPWVLVATEGSVEATSAGAVLFLAWSYLAELTLTGLPYLLDRGVLGVRQVRASVFLAATALLAASSIAATKPGTAGVIILGAAADASWLAARAVAIFENHREHEHVFFFPIAIRPCGGWSIMRSARALVVIIAAASLPLSSHLIRSTNIDIPSPVVYPGFSRISWRGLEAVWNRRGESSLPTLADYVAHRAYQDGLSYGRGYSLPRRNERIYLTSYSHAGSVIRAERVVVMRYSRAWLRGVMKTAEGVGKLLVAQGAPVLVLRVPPERYAVSTRATVVSLLALLGFGVALFFTWRQSSPGVMASFEAERPQAGAVMALYGRKAVGEGGSRSLSGCGKGD